MAINGNNNQVTININDIVPPENMATVDNGAVLGNTYSKPQLNEWKKKVENSTQSGIKGVLKPNTAYDPITNPYPTPWLIGSSDLYEKYDVNQSGTFINTKDADDEYIVVTPLDLELNDVQIWIKNGVAVKNLKALPQASVNIRKWEGLQSSDFPLSAGNQVIYEGGFYEVKDGETATITDLPTNDPSKWVQIGGGTDEDEINQIITDRFGVEIIPTIPNIELTQSDATVNRYLTADNSVNIDNTATNSYVIHNYILNGVKKIIVSGYVMKDSISGRVGILGIKSGGAITNLTASLSDYKLVNNLEINVEDFEKISINMAGGFSVIVNFSSSANPDISDYFMSKTGFSEITERRSDRYISNYKGTTALSLQWEVTPFIRVEAGDMLDVEAFGWTSGAPSYAIFDINKKWMKSGPMASSNGGVVNTNYTVSDSGFIIFGNYKVSGEMRVFLNRSANQIELLNSKLPFYKTKEIGFSTPKTLANAKFFEPYLDGDVLKVKQPTSVKDRIVLNDDPKILENRFVGEHSFVYFKGRLLVYYTEAFKIGNEVEDVLGTLSVGMIDEQTEKHTYLQRVIYGGVSGVPDNYNVHRSHAFVKDNQVYVVATVELGTVSEIWMFKSSDGLNFTKVKVISNVGFGFKKYGNLWMVTEQIDGYYYFFYEGLPSGGNFWSVKIARSTTLEGDYIFYQNVTGLGTGGAVGGICVIYYGEKFRIWYHYSPSAGVNLPTYLGYAESPKATPGAFTVINQPFLALENSPIGAGTDQNGDFALLEINGSIWAGYQYAINTPILNGVWCYKKLNGLTYQELFS